MTRATLVILLASMTAAPAVLADTYVRTEKDGTKTYSDRPLPGGEKVVLESAQTYTPAPVSDPTRPQEMQSLEAAANFQYTNCTLRPNNDTSYQNPESVTVTFTVSPSVRNTDVVNLTMDGAQLGNGELSVLVPQPERGSHSVNAEIRDSSGRTMCSASTTFHVQRTNLNSPQRAAPAPRPRPPRPTPH
jgi:hypothetical protein